MPVRFVSASPTALQRLRPVAIVETNKLCGHTWRVKSVAISADGRTVASASSDKTICTWRASDGTKLQTLAGHTGEVTCVSFCVDGLLVSGSADKTLRIWGAVSSEVQAEAKQVMEAHRKDLSALASKDAVLCTGSADKTLKLWNLEDGVLVEGCTMTGHTDSVTAVAISDDNKFIASASYDATVRLWQCPQGSTMFSFAGHTVPVTALAIAPSGQWVASGGNDGKVLVWSSRGDGNVKQEMQAHTDKVASLCFDPCRGSWLASGGRDDHVRVHSLSTGCLLCASKNHVDCVVGLAVSPDGSWLASGAHDHTVRLWRAEKGTATDRLAAG